jgi:hypothetical protein
MQLEKLEILKKDYKEYSRSFDSLKAYLNELEAKNVNVIAPNIISKRLQVPFSVAIHILGLAERINLLKKSYQVFSIGDNYSLGEYDDANNIPDSIYNPATGNKVGKSEFFVDLVYHLNL